MVLWGLSGSERVCPEKSDIRGVIMTFGAFVDNLGFTVDVGTIVGFQEMFDPSDNPEKSYIIVGLPNLGDMVEMTEVRYMYDETDMSDKWVKVNPNDVISVEPWKIGAI